MKSRLIANLFGGGGRAAEVCIERFQGDAPNDHVPETDELGFTLVEATIAMLILLISLLGVSVVFTYAVSYNSGNSNRTKALVILQQEVEKLRSKKFTPAKTDPELSGGSHATQTITPADGGSFIFDVTIDDDPFTSGIQIDENKSIKEIRATVALDSPTAGWQTSVPITVVLRRVRGN